MSDLEKKPFSTFVFVGTSGSTDFLKDDAAKRLWPVTLPVSDGVPEVVDDLVEISPTLPMTIWIEDPEREIE